MIYLLLVRNGFFSQIAERRKLVSSIKSTIADSEGEIASYDQGGSSFSNMDLTSISDDENSVEGQNDIVLSSSYGHPAEQKPEALPSTTSKGFIKSERKSKKWLPQENVVPEVDSIKENEATSLRTDWSEPLPYFLTNTESSVLEDEKYIGLIESSLQVEDNGASDTMSEDVKPPPLAGANVMNVILVAAECAPWSKTGILFAISFIWFPLDTHS